MLKTYAHHKPSEDALDRIRVLREAFSELHQMIVLTVHGPSRERAIALTELETAAMWAIKAVVCNDPHSVVEGEAKPAPA